MMGTNACYSCGESGHMVKDFPIRRSQEQGRREFSLMFQVKRLEGGNDSSNSSLEVQGKAEFRVSRLN